MQSENRCKVIALLLLFAAPVWVACLFLAAETGWVIYSRKRFDIAYRAVITAADVYRKADDLVFQKVSKTHPPPDSVPWSLPARDSFMGLDESGRRELAAARGELVLVCDVHGIITEAYPCIQTPELKLLSGTVSVGDSLDAVLPQQEFNDALNALRQAGKSGKTVRDYHIPLPDGEIYLAEFNALKISDTPLFAVFFGDSRYETYGKTYRPNIYRKNWYSAQFLNSEFWTNSKGMRDRETEVPKPKGIVRIVCVGGSTTVEGPHNELTYPNFLERLLREHLRTDTIEVINGGVDALGFPTEMERMPDWMSLEPDLIIHYNIVNDLPNILINAVNKSEMREGWRGRARKLAAKSTLLTALFPQWFLPPEELVIEEIKMLANECFEKMTKQAQEAGASLAVASFVVPDINTISSHERLYFDASFNTVVLTRATTADYNWAMGLYNRTVREYCQESGVLYIPVAENFSGGADTFTDICHMRLRGIELKAKIMADHLEAFVQTRLEEYQANTSTHVAPSM